MNKLITFVDFLLLKVYDSQPVLEKYIKQAFQETFLDVKFHFPNLTEQDLYERIVSNQNELAIFLFRLGSSIPNAAESILKYQFHWLLKELCGMEIYFNNRIDVGFYIIHGEGTVIGSRNVIGKGFKIHQGCTIGHKINGKGNGNIIGDFVNMYANSSIIGENKIGNNVTIGAHVLVSKDIPDNAVVISTSRMQIIT